VRQLLEVTMFPEQLQTSPYLTCVRPGERPAVVYMTDDVSANYPCMSDPGDAAFGAIGLDRRVVWHPDPAALEAMQTAAPEPVPAARLAEAFGAELVADLVSRGWLQDPAELCTDYYLRTGQIEVTAHCNWGCRFCPVATDPKPRKTMPLDLFAEIITKLKAYPTVKYVGFHFYNEPTLDKFFAQRIAILRAHAMKLVLFTNGSALTETKLRLLKDSGILYQLTVNLPTLGESEFRSLTGSSTHAATLRNLETAARLECFPLKLCVNGIGPDLERNLEQLRARFEPMGIEVFTPQMADRAGVLDNEYFEDIHVTGRLRGCNWPVNHAYFTVDGDLFLCANDYYQREVFGHVRDGSLHDVMTSPAAVRLRRQIFGVEEAPGDFICRTCHDQKLDYVHRPFRPLATFPLIDVTRRP
jgi:radical SAM family protein/iron-sulfur cluster protein